MFWPSDVAGPAQAKPASPLGDGAFYASIGCIRQLEFVRGLPLTRGLQGNVLLWDGRQAPEGRLESERTGHEQDNAGSLRLRI